MQAIELGNKKIFTKEISVRSHDIYLSGAIEAPENYIEEFEAIRHMSPNDQCIIHINTPGGYCSTAIQFIRCIKESEGAIMASIEGECKSAGTFIMLACDEWSVSEYSEVMCHNYSAGAYGKGNELWEKAQHEYRWSTEMLRGIYKDFLTEDEIDKLLDGKDYYFTPEETADRLERVAEARNKEIEEEHEEYVAAQQRYKKFLEQEVQKEYPELTFEHGDYTIGYDQSNTVFTIIHEDFGDCVVIESDTEVNYGALTPAEQRKFIQKFTKCPVNKTFEDMEKLFVNKVLEIVMGQLKVDSIEPLGEPQ